MSVPVDIRSEYVCWTGMKQRCLNPKHPAFEHYGGRGIKICSRWLNSFGIFLADMGHRPSPEHSIDRINNEGNYSPVNCRWATPKEQASNKRQTDHRFLTLGKRTMTVKEWAKELDLEPSVIFARLYRGWPLARVLTTPIRGLSFKGRRLSIRKWARIYGIAAGTIQSRLRCGWSVARALTTPVKGLYFEGRKLPGYEWARIYGITLATLQGRLRLGWSMERALTTPARKGSKKT